MNDLKDKGLYVEILKYFNSVTSFQKQETINDYQMDALAESIRVFGVDGVKKGFLMAESSDYLTGRKGCDWRADFNWLIKPHNLQKVLNGNYVDFKYRRKFVFVPEPLPNSSFEPDEFYDAALSRGFGE